MFDQSLDVETIYTHFTNCCVFFQMFLTEITINQVVVELRLKKSLGPIRFNYESYAEFYGVEQPPTYCHRYLTDFTYKISRNIYVQVYIFENIEHWCSKRDFTDLLACISAEIGCYSSAEPRFDFRICNIHCSFPLVDYQYNLLKDHNRLSQRVEQYKTNFPNIKLNKTGEIPDNFFLEFGHCGKIKIFLAQRRGTLITKSVEKLLTIEENFVRFCANGIEDPAQQLGQQVQLSKWQEVVDEIFSNSGC